MFLSEFVEFLCRVIYARFSMNLDANLLGPEYARLAGNTEDKKDRDAKLDQANPSRQMLPDEEEK